MSRILKIVFSTALKFSIAFLCTVHSALAQSGTTEPMLKDNSMQPAINKMEMDNDVLKPFALIELFTSEGCSSCPSADRNLERIAQRAAKEGLNIYALSYHVDYWNYLGWDDPYNSEVFSDRQRGYARQFQSSRVYTPQMVINGQAEFVGSDRKKSDRAIELAMKIQPSAKLNLKANLNDGKVKVDWLASGDQDGTLRIVLVQNELLNKDEVLAFRDDNRQVVGMTLLPFPPKSPSEPLNRKGRPGTNRRLQR